MGRSGKKSGAGLRQTLMAMRDLMAWQARLIEEALRQLPEGDQRPGRGREPRERRERRQLAK